MAYKAFNAASPTTAAPVKVTTGTSIKTMLQLATPSTTQMRIISWGFSLDAAPATTGVGVVELIDTDVGATVTAHVAAGCPNITNPNGTATKLTMGTEATGYTATAEDTVTAARLFDAVEISGVSNGAGPTAYSYQFMPDSRPLVAVSKFVRVRVTFSAAVNALVWVVWDEI